MNVDALRTNDAIDSTIENITQNNVDIACTPETHNGRNDILEIKGYAIFFQRREYTRNKPKPIKAGVDIAAKTTWANNIINIERINSTIMEIKIKQIKI